ncbi:DUF4386 family protein [Hymenobacter sp. HD11105]
MMLWFCPRTTALVAPVMPPSTPLSTAVALFNFIYAYQLVQGPSLSGAVQHDQLLQLVNARRFGMHIAYIIFELYLLLKGVLIYKASYIPTVLGVLLM